MTVLVTGGAGYIGSHMVYALLDAGERVVALDNLATGFDWAVAQDASLIIGDVGDQPLVTALITEHRIDAIIHFAASVVVPDSVRDPLGYYLNNAVKSRALIEAAVKGAVRHFIFSSTAAVYGNPERVPAREDDATVPTSPYGSSKLMTEIMLRDAGSTHGLPHVILRYFNVAGADPLGRTGQSSKEATHLIKVVTQAALGLRAKVDVFGADYPTPDGTCIRDYIHIVDLAQAHILALAPGKQGFYNLGNGDGYSVREVIQMCEKVSGKKIPAIEKPRRPGDPPKLVASADKAIRELGWKPRFPKLEAIVSTAWEWHKQHPHGYAD